MFFWNNKILQLFLKRYFMYKSWLYVSSWAWWWKGFFYQGRYGCWVFLSLPFLIFLLLRNNVLLFAFCVHIFLLLFFFFWNEYTENITFLTQKKILLVLGVVLLELKKVFSFFLPSFWKVSYNKSRSRFFNFICSIRIDCLIHFFSFLISFSFFKFFL